MDRSMLPKTQACRIHPAPVIAMPTSHLRRPQQVGDQPQVQEVGLGLLRGRVLLEHQPGPDEQRGDERERDAHQTAPGWTGPLQITLAPALAFRCVSGTPWPPAADR